MKIRIRPSRYQPYDLLLLVFFGPFHVNFAPSESSSLTGGGLFVPAFLPAAGLFFVADLVSCVLLPLVRNVSPPSSFPFSTYSPSSPSETASNSAAKFSSSSDPINKGVFVDLAAFFATAFLVAERAVLELEVESGFAGLTVAALELGFSLEDDGLEGPALVSVVALELEPGVALLLCLTILG